MGIERRGSRDLATSQWPRCPHHRSPLVRARSRRGPSRFCRVQEHNGTVPFSETVSKHSIYSPPRKANGLHRGTSRRDEVVSVEQPEQQFGYPPAPEAVPLACVG